MSLPPTSPPPDAGLADDPALLAEELGRVLVRLIRRVKRESPETGEVSPLLGMLLSDILENPGIGVAELARRENLRGPTISAHVKALEGAGLLARVAPPSTAPDRRRTGLALTERGRAELEARRRRRAGWLAGEVARLSPAGRAALAAALAPLREIAS